MRSIHQPRLRNLPERTLRLCVFSFTQRRRVCRVVSHAIIVGLLMASVCCPETRVAADDDLEQREAEHFFERDIRPLLAENCFQCHGERAEKVKGDLLLDSRAGMLQGGQSGASVEPGHPDLTKTGVNPSHPIQTLMA